MKKTILVLAAFVITTSVIAQAKKTTTSATISFDATTSLDAQPKAENKTVIAALDTKKGMLQFEATVKSFSFTNPKMQEHFNGKGWMDSDQFPTATFKGKITDLKTVQFSSDGTYNVNVEGDLTIHGVTKKVTTAGVITIAGGKISSKADFTIMLADYSIDAPQVGAGKVSKDPKISVSATF
jgi:polyisoprenoid-binding protein YceI